MSSPRSGGLGQESIQVSGVEAMIIGERRPAISTCIDVQSSMSPGVITRRKSVTAWYLPDGLNHELTSAELVKSTYDQAIQFHREHFKSSDSNSWLSQKSTVFDVLGILNEARTRYEVKKASRPKTLSTAMSWWRLASSRIMQFEKVVDTVVSSHPEYAALLWGGMRFLFSVTLNHEELSTKIARSFADIGAVLPELDFIAQKLYPARQIQHTLVTVYAQVIEFCIRATRWYDKVRRSMFQKILRPILKAWPLEFEDIRSNIDSCFRRLREQSAVAHQAETRDVHAKIDEIHGFFAKRDSFQRGFANDATTLRPNPSIAETIPFIKERVLLHLAHNSFDAGEAIQAATFMRDRRRARGLLEQQGLWKSKALLDWLSDRGSSVILLQGSAKRSEESRDIALDIIDLLKSEEVPVIWYLATPSTDTTAPLSMIDMLRSWIQQLIDQAPYRFSASELNEASVHRCTAFDDWLRLFFTALGHLPMVALIVDAHGAGAPGIIDTVKRFWEMTARQQCTTILKTVLLTYEDAEGSFPVTEPTSPTISFSIIKLGPHLTPRSSRILVRAGRRRSGRPRAKRDPGCESLRPLARQLSELVDRKGQAEDATMSNVRDTQA